MKPRCNGLAADQVADIVIAYEPIWAIGTGRTASPEDANTVIGHIRAAGRSLGTARWRPMACASCTAAASTAKTVAGLMAMPEIDGALVGGASLIAARLRRHRRGGGAGLNECSVLSNGVRSY